MPENVLKHYGTKRHSGRYPWGSGQDPNQRTSDFSSRVRELKKRGLTEKEIAVGEGMSIAQLRAKISLDKDEKRRSNVAEVIRLKDKGVSNMEIGRRMGINESTVRSLLDPVLNERASVTKSTAAMLKDSVDKYGYVDIGKGVENYIGVSRHRLSTAVSLLQEQGYKIHGVNVEQLGIPGQFTIMKVLGHPDSKWSEVVRDPSLIKPVTAYSEDFGRSFNTSLGLKPIQSVKSSQVQVRYAKEGGALKDGVIELRRGVPDLDLGKSRYAQVRVAVNGTHFMKGMAIYTDDLPPGINIRFNTNKHDTGNKLDAMKPMKEDLDNPFGSTIRRQHGALNIIDEEGKWDTWSRSISSQILSKQSVPLAKKQLGLDFKQKQDEYDEIMRLTNPVIKRQLLNSFADDCDSSAVHLQAAALPRQASKVILPVPSLKEHEVYAPSFKDGESVVLIRHPHGGTFEIPQLIVNNKSRTAKAVMENAIDAIGINPKVARKLSGADFDGDTVIIIPNNRGLIKTSASLKGLEDFDPIEQYRIPKGSNIPPIKSTVKQTKMGEVSNLITDMTIKGAPPNEIARAVRHSMVVIDSEKHNLDYRQSYIDHNIAGLSEKYQNSKRGGAATLVSRASSDTYPLQRKPRPMAEGGPIDRLTGEKVYVPTGASSTKVKYKDPATGRIKETYPSIAKAQGYEIISTKEIFKTTKSKKMSETKDAHTLSSGRPIEEVYANHANALKALANTARKSTFQITPILSSPSAKRVYSAEVSMLNAKLNVAQKNAPLERQAQILANSIVSAKRRANPDMTPEDKKKVRNQALAEARIRTGAKKTLIVITDKEWEAIQAGAISTSKLKDILQNTDLNRVKQLATPRSKPSLTSTKINKAKLMLSKGATQSDVADALGVSIKVLMNALNTDEERSK